MKATQFFMGFGPATVELPARRDRVRRARAAARRLRADHRHEQPRRGRPGRRGADLPPEELPAAHARDHGRLDDAHAASPSCCSSRVFADQAASSSSDRVPRSTAVAEPTARPPRPASQAGDMILSHRRRRRRRRPTSSASAVRTLPARRHRRRSSSSATASGDRRSATLGANTDAGARYERQALLGVASQERQDVASDSIAAAGGQQRHRPGPGDVGVDEGRRQGAQPGQHRSATSPAPTTTSPPGRPRWSASPRSAATIGDPTGSSAILLPARRAQRLRRRVQHVPAAARSTVATRRSPPTSGSASAEAVGATSPTWPR